MLLIAYFVGIFILVFLAAMVWRTKRQKARRLGYRSIGEYLRAVPRTDEEKQDAVDLALKGLAVCLIGVFLRPLFLIGIFPLYYGTRKVLYAFMGLGLVDDADHRNV
jgi:hypothetical protein